MQSIANIKSISYLKSHAAQISEDLEMNGNPFVITQNGEASMVIEGVKQFQEKESLIAALKIIAWARRTAYKEKAFRLQNHGRNCWPLAKAANNGGLYSSRCPGGLAFASGLHARQVGEVAWLKAEDEILKSWRKLTLVFSMERLSKNSHQWAS
jgi:hypothetical protein